MATASASKKRSHAGKKGKPHTMVIKKVANGFTADTHHEPGDSDANDTMGDYNPTEQTVHPDGASVMAHFAKKFGVKMKDGPGKDGSKKHEGSESAAVEQAEQDGGDDDGG